MPGEEEGLIKVVEDIDDDVVVAGAVDLGTRELVVDEDTLLGDTQWRNGAVGNVPCVVHVRVFSPYGCCQEAQHQHGNNPANHFLFFWFFFLLVRKSTLSYLLPRFIDSEEDRCFLLLLLLWFGSLPLPFYTPFGVALFYLEWLWFLPSLSLHRVVHVWCTLQFAKPMVIFLFFAIFDFLFVSQLWNFSCGAKRT